MKPGYGAGLLAALLAVLWVGGSSCGKQDSTARGALQTRAKTSRPSESPNLRLEKEVSFDVDTGLPGWSGRLRVWDDLPIVELFLTNNTTRVVQCWEGLYVETYSRIELLDANGAPVGRTLQGQQIATRTNANGIRSMAHERFRKWFRGRARTDGFRNLGPGQFFRIQFSIPELFELTNPGEYTLKFQTCLIRKPEADRPEVQVHWLPEMQIRFRMLPPNGAASVPAGEQTNEVVR